MSKISIREYGYDILINDIKHLVAILFLLAAIILSCHAAVLKGELRVANFRNIQLQYMVDSLAWRDSCNRAAITHLRLWELITTEPERKAFIKNDKIKRLNNE